jgi:hypothetical protein
MDRTAAHPPAGEEVMAMDDVEVDVARGYQSVGDISHLQERVATK